MTSQTPNPILVQQALQATLDFENSIAPSLWPNLDKKQVVADMRSRINDPFLVNQGGQPFCGPAAILFELVRKQPLRYAQICRSLFETGSCQTQTKHVEAPPRLRQSQGQLRMSQADWMVLATLRNSENLIFPVDPNAPEIIRNLSGMTKSWEMNGWAREVLGYTNVKYDHTYIFGELDALQEAANAIAKGGVAFALITAEGLLENQHPLVPYPSHWISLLGNISIQPGTFGQPNSGKISFDIYTWAQKRHVDVSQDTFKDYLWGIVMGE